MSSESFEAKNWRLPAGEILSQSPVERLISCNLKERPWRFNELQRDIEGISQKVLTDSLRQMIDDGLVYRHDYQEMPPKVEYGLTELGKEMLPIIDALADFGNYYKSIIDWFFTDASIITWKTQD